MGNLDTSTRGEVLAAAMKVVEGNASVHVHKLTGSDFVSFGVNRNALRVICEREGETLLMLHVASHDDAYDWARRHRTVRVGQVIRFLAVDTESVPADVPAKAQHTASGPLADIRDRVFSRFGVGPHAARALRRAGSEDAVLELAEHMRPPIAEALIGLATIPDDLQGLVRRFEDARDVEGQVVVTPLAEAVRAPVNAGAVWLPRSARALRSALEGDLESWRVFLHPSQQALVRKHMRGAAKVTGGPGTGKTVVAVHRARFLAEQAGEGAKPVLLTTLTRTLTEQLQTMVTQMCCDEPHLIERLHVRSLVVASQSVLTLAGLPHTVATPDVLQACWATAHVADTLGWSVRDYSEEREQVVARNGAWTGTAYLTTTRRGRSTRLDRRARRQVWSVLEAFEQALAETRGGDPVALAREATRAVLRGDVPSPWRAVVCDEVQDASASELRFLAALARDPETEQIRPDGLFLCGDGYQRLYATAVPLVACGIEVRGRSRRLRLNYRTTEGIRRAAIEVVRGLDLDDLDTLSEGEDSPFDGYRSVRGGPPPQVERFETHEAEAAWIALRAQVGPVLVLARTQAYLNQLAEQLRAQGCAVHVLEGRGSMATTGVTVCTLHRSKGLEASQVVIAGRQLVPGRFPGGGAGARRRFQRQERCLLYVGMTRARDWCGVTSVEGA